MPWGKVILTVWGKQWALDLDKLYNDALPTSDWVRKYHPELVKEK